MVTKGIITSIDFNGNTCQVRIPLFEAAGNDPITGTAIVSNTPGSYNGYKVGDVVLVAFEDGKMQNPVIVGKLYLGAAKEKQDPRGTINVETTTASKSASLPADAVLTANVDSNVPNTNTPFGSLASIANNLNSLNTDVNQLDRFTRNQFNSVITDVNGQGEQLRSEIKQTAENIEANVVHTHKDGSQKGLGWDLTTDSWKINAQDTVVNGVAKDINIVTIDRNGMSIAGDLKLNGYPKNIIVRYAQNGSDKDYPYLYNFKQDDFPDTEIDKTWYYNKYIKIIEAGKEKYILISSGNIDDYTITPGETVAYIYNQDEINTEWKTETPARVDGQYIWQWTHTESFSFDGNKWDEQDDDKIVCITGAKGEKGKDGSNGTPATTYWAKLSTAVHTGKNQKSNIEITPYVKTGSSPEAIDTTAHFKYSLDNGASWNSKKWTLLQGNKIVILAKDIIADNIIIKLAHAYTDPNDSTKFIYSEYETETITYSPLNTPIIDLTNDTDVIKYKPDGNKITADVSSTAQVYLGGSPEAADYDWAVTSGNATISKSNSNQTVTVTSITRDKAIITCTATTTNFKDENGKAVQISKDFVVSREVAVASYWLSFSPIHTGNLQQTDIEVKALAKIGNDRESKDTNAYFRYSWDNGTTWIHKDWTKPTDATLIIPKADIQNNNLRIQATHDSTGTDRQVYEDETITYSPLNTPVLDLTNDSDAIAYDGNTILGNSVSSTATVYLNGVAVSGCAFAWTAANCAISGANTATVTVSAIDDGESEGTATCRVTGIPNYPNTELVKVFTVAKQYKGNHGADGPAPTSSTTYYIYSADKPDLDDTKWETDPANLKKPSGGYFCWTKTVTKYSDGKTITDGPNKDAAFALAQDKSTNYYSPAEPIYNIKEGDCWFDTGYANVGALKNKTDYLGKFVISTTGDILVEQDENDSTRYIPNAAGSTKLIKVTPENIDTLINNKTIVVGATEAFETGNLKQCSSLDANGKATWTDIAGELVTNKLTANYINAMDITAKKITVLQDNSKESNDSNPILFQADGTSNNSGVKIGGFTVDSNRLYAGTPGTSNSIELASFHNLIAYKSNNQGVASSYAVSKITVNKATDLTVYIRSYAESSCDYTMISNPNVPSYPTSHSSGGIKALTMGNQNSSSELTGYTKVNYYNLKQNDYIYIVYRKDGSINSGTDTGYLLIPETTDISITTVDDTYYFVRDPSLDISRASIKVGSNFSVDSTGAIKSTSGTIGGFEVTSDDLHTAGTTIGNTNSLFLSSNGITDRLGIGGSSGEQTWSITAGKNFGVTKDGKVYANDVVIDNYFDTISIGTNIAGMYFKSKSTTNPGDCYVRTNEIKNTGRLGYNIAFEDSNDKDKRYSASISILADKPTISEPYQEAHYAWEQGIELKTYNPADKDSGASANNAALRIGYYSSQGSILPTEANKKARGFLGDVWCPTGIFRCKNGNIVPYIYGFKSGLLDTYSDEYEYGFYFNSNQLERDSWASWYYGNTFTGIDCVIISMGLNTMYDDTKPGSLAGSKANENSFYFIDHRNKYVYWYNDTGNKWTVDVFIVGYKQRAAGTFIGEQEIK